MTQRGFSLTLRDTLDLNCQTHVRYICVYSVHRTGPCYCQESLSIVGTDALAMEAVPEQKTHTTLLGCVNVQCLISAKCSYPKKVSFTAVMNVKQSTVAMYHRLAG